MRFAGWLCVTTASLALAGCGSGGGGGTSSAGTVAPPAAPSAPAAPTTNTTLTNLQASQTFTNDAAATTVSFDLTNKTTISGKAAAESLLVNYDAASQSYTVTTGTRSQTFAPGDVQSTDTDQYQTVYQKADATARDRLTLVKTPYTGSTQPQYVGLGFWQRNTISGNRQDTTFDVFTYGLPTAAAAVPRTGTAAFGIDSFGLASAPGSEPNEFQGHGTLSVDLTTGVFSSNTAIQENGLVTGKASSASYIYLITAGRLSSGDGTFSGNIRYVGTYAKVAGSITGRFYGPGAEEVGASFSGSNADGTAVNGGFTGQRDANAALTNSALTNLVTSQAFTAQASSLTAFYITGLNPPWAVSAGFGAIDLTYHNDKSYGYGYGFPNFDTNSASIVTQGDQNFQSYRASVSGHDVQFDLYKAGKGNTELALTYASFGRWGYSDKQQPAVNAQDTRMFFVYGFETPAGLLAAKSGTGHYAGVAYGSGITRETHTIYELKGTSGFDVDFSRQSYTGALALKSTATSDGTAAMDFGNFTFAGKLSTSTPQNVADLMQNGSSVGSINHRFYGPDGEEIGGPFTISSRDAAGHTTVIAGVTLAKRQ